MTELWKMLNKRAERDGPSEEDWRKAFKIRDALKLVRAKREGNETN